MHALCGLVLSSVVQLTCKAWQVCFKAKNFHACRSQHLHHIKVMCVSEIQVCQSTADFLQTYREAVGSSMYARCHWQVFQFNFTSQQGRDASGEYAWTAESVLQPARYFGNGLLASLCKVLIRGLVYTTSTAVRFPLVSQQSMYPSRNPVACIPFACSGICITLDCHMPHMLHSVPSPKTRFQGCIDTCTDRQHLR